MSLPTTLQALIPGHQKRQMPVDVERLLIDGPAGHLEAMLERPQLQDPAGRVAAPTLVAVICHPHPQFQGTMLNKVVHTLSRSCTDQGIPALRFNYRGVGRSDGAYDEGRGETDDAEAAVAYLQEIFPQAGIVLAGFSFGSGVVLRLAAARTAQILVTVAPPVGRLGVPETVSVTMPWLVIQGGNDELVPAADVEDWVAKQSPPPEFYLLKEASHFFHGNLNLLRQRAGEFLAEHRNK